MGSDCGGRYSIRASRLLNTDKTSIERNKTWKGSHTFRCMSEVDMC